jgi:L-fuculose-phosphate aldolase
MIQHFEARQQVLDACLRLAERGFLVATGGNVSLRIGTNLLAVTPSGVDYYSMSPQDICVLRLDTLEVTEGDLKPSIECGLHATLLRFRTDAAAVIHTHQPIASAVALLSVPLSISDVGGRHSLGAVIEVVPYAPSGTWLLIRALKRRLKRDVNAYLLRNHGLICCGATMQEAFANAEAAERVAAHFLRNAIKQTGAPAELAAFALEALQHAEDLQGRPLWPPWARR